MLKQLSLFENESFVNEDIATETEWQAFRFVDLFSGIGGIRLPFQELGGVCVFSSEIDKFAIETYRANFNETPYGDITKIREEEIPPFDILLAGFPCQAFSIAGKRRGFEDARGTLFFDVARIIKYHKPKVFLLENVKGLLSHNHGETFKTMLDILENDLNYKVFYKVLNAKDYGVPQNRERVIIVGFSDHSVEFEFPKPYCENVIVGDILEKNVSDRYTISDRIWESHQRRKEEHKKKGNGFGYSLFNEKSSYTSTISARYYKDGSEILIEQKGKNPRKLTPREAARLQGFPESFKIVVSDNQAYKQFGNSVSTKMIRAVADEIINFLRSKMNTKISITGDIYSNNLNFYACLKFLFQCRLSEKQLLLIQKTVNENKSLGYEKLCNMLLQDGFVMKSSISKYENYNYFVNSIEKDNLPMWCDYINVACELLLIKDLILQESKQYALREYKKELKEITDNLSVEYDMSGRHMPYGQRVISALLVSVLTDTKRDCEFFLTSSENTVKAFSDIFNPVISKYSININNIFQIIMDESMNQSIKSDAGSSYESRVHNALLPIVDDLKGHSHDKNIPSVEYDNTFTYNGKYCGVSAKRTLRERYKQNFEDIASLEVDYMFVVTLGIDLNEDKLTNILQRDNYFVIVSKEQFESKSFFKSNPRVLSSNNIAQKFKEIIV